MSFDTLIAKTRQAFADDAAKAHVVLSAQGTLVGVTEVDVKTGAHSFKADEPRSIGGGAVAANPVTRPLIGPQRRLLGSATRSSPRRQASRASPRIAIMMMPENTRAVFR
jgi:hypothetical protein